MPRHLSACILLALLLAVPGAAGAPPGTATAGVGARGAGGESGAGSRPAAAMMVEAPPDTTTTIGAPTVLGRLDQEKIDRVLNEKLREIRYCYQRELYNQPTLAGRITVTFVIEPDGTVSSAFTEATTMHDPTVESCLNGRFLRMTFPKPKRGDTVVATCPFTFVPGKTAAFTGPP